MRAPLVWSATISWEGLAAACVRNTFVRVSPAAGASLARLPAAANHAEGGLFRSVGLADTPCPAAASRTSATVLRLSGVSTEKPNSAWIQGISSAIARLSNPRSLESSCSRRTSSRPAASRRCVNTRFRVAGDTPDASARLAAFTGSGSSRAPPRSQTV